MKTRFHFLVGFFVLVSPVCGQGTFQNLDFELATVPLTQPPSTGDPASWVSVSVALPGWSVFLGTNQPITVLFNNETIGSVNAALLSSNNPNGRNAIEGSFGVLLQAGLGDGFVRTEASISQTGIIPADSLSVQFKAFQNFPSRPFALFLAGQSLSFVPLLSESTYTLYGADIAAYAGQTAELRITSFTPDEALNNVYLDSITFSTEPIPEPNTLSLFALGSLLLGWRTCRRRKT